MASVTIPDLRTKCLLLYGRVKWTDDKGTHSLLHQKDLGKAIKLGQKEISLALSGDSGTVLPYLPLSKLPKFLNLLGLDDVPQVLADDDQWVEIVKMPLPAFCAEIARRGGIRLLHSKWDEFVAQVGAAPSGREGNTLRILAGPPEEWKTLTRMLAPGQPDPLAELGAGLPTLHVGDWACIELEVGRIAERQLHVFMFQDIVLETNSQHTYIPLLPSPPTRFVMPQPRIASGECLFIPGCDSNKEQQYFQVPAGWGSRRRLAAVLTQHKVDDQVYSPEQNDGWTISAGRLDELAMRLERKDFGRWQLLVFDYIVRERPREGAHTATTHQ
jgi:hypothetical protein